MSPFFPQTLAPIKLSKVASMTSSHFGHSNTELPSGRILTLNVAVGELLVSVVVESFVSFVAVLSLISPLLVYCSTSSIADKCVEIYKIIISF